MQEEQKKLDEKNRHSSKDLWIFVEDAEQVVENQGTADWVDLRNLLRVIYALQREKKTG